MPLAQEESGEMPRGNFVTIGLSVLVLLFVSTVAFTMRKASDRAPLLGAREGQFAAAEFAADAPEIRARAAVVYDITRDTFIYERNADAQLALASLTKIMLALVATREIPADTTVSITPEALKTEGDTGLRVGERWKLQDLIDATLIASSNDGAQALALAVGQGDAWKTVIAMNKLARAVDLPSMYFLNPTGLDESNTQAGAYGSAKDFARLLAYALKNQPDLLDGTARDGMLITSDSGIEHTAINTNEALGQIPGLIAGKTGTTDLAGGNLAVVFDMSIGRPIAIVVLGSTYEGRFEDVRTLVHLARKTLQN